jgi:hypothetical protein
MGFMAKKPLAKKRARAGSSSSEPLSKVHKPRVFAIHGGKARRAAIAAARPPAVENRHTFEQGHAITYQLRPVLCGKPGCARHHGPYWYAYWTQGNTVRTRYIGRNFRKVSEKYPDAFRAGERFARS